MSDQLFELCFHFNGDAESLRRLIQEGVGDIEARDGSGETPLMLAAGDGDADRVRVLIDAGADVNARRQDGRTALMNAAGSGGDADRVRLLIEAGADVNAVTQTGWAALMDAAIVGDADRVRLLIENGADVNHRRQDGRTALMDAAQYSGGDADRVRVLIENGADVNAREEDGWTALMLAVQWGWLVNVQILVQNGASISAVSSDGRTALDIALEENRHHVASYLRQQETTVDLSNLDISVPEEEASTHQETETAPSSQDIAASLDPRPGRQPVHGMHFSEVSLGQELGRGSFSIVFQGTWHGVDVAVKCIRLPSTHGTAVDASEDEALLSEVFRDRVLPEVEMLGALRHPFVVECYGSCQNPPSIILELCPQGSLGHLLLKCREDPVMATEMSWHRRLCMMRQVASAMSYLHNRRGGCVLHRDLRSMNVVVTNDWTAKVSDVGLGRFTDEVSSRSAGTLGDGANPRWLAPEVCGGSPFTMACDVYGFGTIIWEMLEWRLPWEGKTSNQIIFALARGAALEVCGEDRWPLLPGPVPRHPSTLGHFCNLVSRCLSKSAEDRPSFADIVTLLSSLEEAEIVDADTVDPASVAGATTASRDPLHRLPTCTVCFDVEACMIMSGCGHLCLCQGCSDQGQFQDCPICRRAGLPQRVFIP